MSMTVMKRDFFVFFSVLVFADNVRIGDYEFVCFFSAILQKWSDYC